MSEFMSHDRFVQYFPMLVLDQRALPKKREAILTLLVSIMIDIDVGKPYTEWRLNAKLRAWVEKYGELIGLDHVAVRRMLVDEGYLHRDKFGKTYVMGARSPYFSYEPSIRTVNLPNLVEQASQLRAVRKQA